ncbi:MAG TPA: hypothetical protein VGU69_09100 [Rhizomicrobium sp.]|nr:hypothetical protein [Rhizomicrobium sp.]
MRPFSGVEAAMASLRFLSEHIGELLKLVAPWAALTTAFVIAYAYFGQPAGPEATLGQTLQYLAAKPAAKQLVTILPDFLGDLVVSVGWTRFILLAEDPSFTKFAHTGAYFVATFKLSLAAIGAAIPGALLIVISIAGGSVISAIFAVLGGIAIVLGAGFVYLRYSPVLSASAVGENASMADSFGLTAGKTWSLALGLFLTYVIAFVPFLIVSFIVGALLVIWRTGEFLMFFEFITQLWTLLTACVLSGFFAKTYQALAPGDIGDQTARVFD